jgi:hypothetical protein
MGLTCCSLLVLMMPDTQFLYWGGQGSINPEPQVASFRYVIENSSTAQNIVFLAHLGDLTEDGEASSFQYVNTAFDVLDDNGVAYSVLAGNHDVSGDDTRGDTPYLETMGPRRFRNSPTFAGSDSTGYNTAHIFRAGGREWLLLAMDWRTSSGGFDWANEFIKAHPKLPVILTTHEILEPVYDDNVYPYQSGDPDNDAEPSSYGQTVRRLHAHHELPEPVLRRRRDDPAVPLRPGTRRHRHRDHLAVDPVPAT